MKNVTIESVYVIEVFTKTTNQNRQAAKDIPALWQRFMKEETGLKLTNKIDNEIICAYLEYEGDHMAPYTCVVGYKVPNLENIPKGMKGITIPGGNYSKFLAKGDLTGKALWDVWMSIWTSDLDRTYHVDFELYGDKTYPIENGEADVFIGVK